MCLHWCEFKSTFLQFPFKIKGGGVTACAMDDGVVDDNWYCVGSFLNAIPVFSVSLEITFFFNG